jgi:hypothetical protein
VAHVLTPVGEFVKAFTAPMNALRVLSQRLPALCVCLLSLAAVSGCGGGQSPERQVQSTLRQFARDVAQRNYRELCTQLLAGNLTDKLAEIGLPCERAMAKGLGQAHDPTLRILDVHVKGSRATAVVNTSASNQPSSRVTLELVQTGGRWRISSLGPASS